MADERKDHLWKVAQEVEDRIDDLDKAGATHGPGRGHQQGGGRASRSARTVETARPAQRVHPGALLALHREHPRPERHRLLPRRRASWSSTAPPPRSFANMFNADVRRPMADGLINPREKSAMPVLEAILQTLIPQGAHAQGEILAFSVPAATAGQESELTYHEATLRRYFEAHGLQGGRHQRGPGRHLLRARGPELHRHRHLLRRRHVQRDPRLPVDPLDHVQHREGRRLHRQLGRRRAERARHAREGAEGREPRPVPAAQGQVREGAPHLLRGPGARRWWTRCAGALSRAEKLPQTDRPLPIVLSGGTAKPKGFKELFERTLEGRSLPIEIAGVRLASDPLTATARGALIAAHVREVGR